MKEENHDSARHCLLREPQCSRTNDVPQYDPNGHVLSDRSSVETLTAALFLIQDYLVLL